MPIRLFRDRILLSEFNSEIYHGDRYVNYIWTVTGGVVTAGGTSTSDSIMVTGIVYRLSLGQYKIY